MAAERHSPYQGLLPYDERDAPFFFGRERETRLIVANLFAAPLTILYGPSGVGKSSVLRAGVLRQLRTRDDLLVVPFSAWSGDPLHGLAAALAEAVPATAPDHEPVLGSLAEQLSGWSDRLDRRVMILLDQFEEYFLYRPGDDPFAVELPKALSNRARALSVVISIREDSLAKLDRFEGVIPSLFDNYLRLDHLDREAARAAIEKPIDQYNRLCITAGAPFHIEAAMVEAVLDEVRTGSVVLGEAGRGVTRAEAAAARIETP